MMFSYFTRPVWAVGACGRNRASTNKAGGRRWRLLANHLRLPIEQDFHNSNEATAAARPEVNHFTKEKNMAAKQMTKSQLAAHIAEKFSLSKKAANDVIDELASVAVAQTKKAGAFTLPGIGKLVKANRKARMGRNPATGEAIKIPAKTVVKFRVAKAAKDNIVPPKAKK
jgi:DNA-binding protein HU-beta